MTSSQLEALIIDQALGELSEDTSALLDAYLDTSPDREAVATRIRRAVGLTEIAVGARPLDLEDDTAGGDIHPFPARTTRLPRILRLAAAITLLGLALGAGFFAGQGSRDPLTRSDAVAGPGSGMAPSPWARYRVEENGRLAVVIPSDPHS